MTDRYEKKQLFLRIDLRFFDGGEKTEKPTGRKRRKARQEGQVAKSQEVGTAFLFISVFFALGYFALGMFNKLMELLYYSFTMLSSIDDIYNIAFISQLVWFMFAQALLIVLPVFAVSMLVGLVSNIIQVGWHPTFKPLMPKLSKLNPIKGVKRLFSFQSVVSLIKSIVKFVVILSVIYSMMQDEIDHIPDLMNLEIYESLAYLGKLVVDMGIRVGVMFLFLALADYVYVRFKHTKDLKMSKQEVKEEMKSVEGNPQVKGKIKQKMREISMRRMMQELPKADVIITNPTHYAVALQYKKDEFMAPVVTAKGVDFLAKKIREVAKEHGIEIVENKQLARNIYASVDVGKEIPPELYQAVAEILAFVYKLKNKAQ